VRTNTDPTQEGKPIKEHVDEEKKIKKEVIWEDMQVEKEVKKEPASDEEMDVQMQNLALDGITEDDVLKSFEKSFEARG